MQKEFLIFFAFLLLAGFASADMIGPEPTTMYTGILVTVFVLNLSINGTIVFLVQKYILKNALQNISGKKIATSFVAITVIGLISDFTGFYGITRYFASNEVIVLTIATFFMILVLDFLLFKYYSNISTKNSFVLALFLAVFSNPAILIQLSSLGIIGVGISFLLVVVLVFAFFYLINKFAENMQEKDKKTLLNFVNYTIITFGAGVFVVGFGSFLVSLPFKQPSWADPLEHASSLLKDAWNHPNAVKTTTANVTFTTIQNNINSSDLARYSKVGISAEQICLSKGDFTESDRDNKLFEINDKKNSITYNGSSNKDARISVYCYTGEQLQNTLKELGSGIDPGWASDCECTNSPETCCLVALRFEKK